MVIAELFHWLQRLMLNSKNKGLFLNEFLMIKHVYQLTASGNENQSEKLMATPKMPVKFRNKKTSIILYNLTHLMTTMQITLFFQIRFVLNFDVTGWQSGKSGLKNDCLRYMYFCSPCKNFLTYRDFRVNVLFNGPVSKN